MTNFFKSFNGTEPCLSEHCKSNICRRLMLRLKSSLPFLKLSICQMKTAGGQKTEGNFFTRTSCFYWYFYVLLIMILRYISEIYLASYNTQHNIELFSEKRTSVNLPTWHLSWKGLEVPSVNSAMPEMCRIFGVKSYIKMYEFLCRYLFVRTCLRKLSVFISSLTK